MCASSTAITPEQEEASKWGILLGKWAVRPLKDRVLVKVDEYSSRRDCSKCKGKGHLDIGCPECHGTERYRGKKDSEEPCTTCYFCTDMSQQANAATWINLHGKQPCDLCNGKGTSSIIIPDESKAPALTGEIIAKGSEVDDLKVGMKVLITKFTGTPFIFDGLNLRHVVERDIICEIKKLREDVTTEDIKETPYDAPVSTGVDAR